MVEQSHLLRPAQPPANDDARPIAGGIVSRSCAFPADLPTAPSNSGEFLVSHDLQNESLIC
jgi:hypothetical protein